MSGEPFTVVRNGRVVARWRGWQTVLDVRERTRERDERWDELIALADQDRVAEFWKRYADYLEWDGIVSLSRMALYKMARRVASERGKKDLEKA